MKAPTRRDAMGVAIQTFNQPVHSCKRFRTGLANYVFDIEMASGQTLVVRFSRPGGRRAIAGGLFWHDQLSRVGIPVAEVLASDLNAPVPYMVLERLPGTDLGNVFDKLAKEQLNEISAAVAAMQRRAADLVAADGFGYGFDYTTPLASAWKEVLFAQVQRSEQRIAAAGLVDPEWVRQVHEHLVDFPDTFVDVEPRPFLHDVTTKNVIVHDGELSGIVDVDEMCFGDPLWTASLTRMSLLAARRSTTYVDPQVADLDPENQHERRFNLYTSIHCLGFLSELGQQFNLDAPAPVSGAFQQRLENLLATLLASV